MKRNELSISLVAVYSSHYPSIGESHCLSVLAGVIREWLEKTVISLNIFDMVAAGHDSIKDLENFLRQNAPNILGISAGYGTYDFIYSNFKYIREAVGNDCWIVFGGPLATYIPHMLFQITDQNTFFVIGEGEVPFFDLVNAWLMNRRDSNLPGVVTKDGGLGNMCRRNLTDLGSLPAPYRDHVPDLYKQGAQIFSETSRGCSWSNCSFCLRGLTDIKGVGSEYRSFKEERILSDLRLLMSKKIRSITFADEDFLGIELKRFEFTTRVLEKVQNISDGSFGFDISSMPDSIYSERMSHDEVQNRVELLRKLKSHGLRKIFLGIESGSESQLKRLNKRHTSKEAIRCIQTVRDIGIDFEIGWIMLDPLCSMEELRENVRFLQENRLAGYASNPFNELRLQCNTSFHESLLRHESKYNCRLIDKDFDPNVLSYSYGYFYKEVSLIKDVLRVWTKEMRPIHYPLKNLSRYGSEGLLGKLAKDIQVILFNLRTELVNSFSDLLTSVQSNSNAIPNVVNDNFRISLKQCALNSFEVLRDSNSGIREHPAVNDFLNYVKIKFIDMH